MTLPVGDWQFWAVTAAAAGGLATLVRPLLAGRGKKGDGPACGHCATGSAACAGEAAKARLAGDGEAPRLRVLR